MTYEYDPLTLDDYNAKFSANHKIEGFGIENIRQHFPCPCCAEADWKVVGMMSFQIEMIVPAQCSWCGRVTHYHIEEPDDATTISWMVLDEGDDPPDYLEHVLHDARPQAEGEAEGE